MSGLQVVCATSLDPEHPPSAAVDGKDASFWMTTGMFPQEIIVALPEAAALSQLTVVSRAVRRMTVALSDSSQPTAFEQALEVEVAPGGDDARDVQFEAHALGGTRARYVKLTIEDAHDEFCAVHKISVA